MNCPSCSAPLFGSASCSCGHRIESRPQEITYWESLRAWWRIYWPTQLLSIAPVAFSAWLAANLDAFAVRPFQTSPGESNLALLWIFTAVLTLLLNAACVWLFLPRIFGRPYQDFLLVACETPGGCASGLTSRQRTALWLFVWWRCLAGGLLALVLVMAFLMLAGKAGDMIVAILPVTGLFAIGPMIMKMLVGQTLAGLQVEARPLT